MDFQDVIAGAELLILAMLGYAKPFFRKLLTEVVAEQLDMKLAPLVSRVRGLEIAQRENARDQGEIERTPTAPISVDFGAAE